MNNTIKPDFTNPRSVAKHVARIARAMNTLKTAGIILKLERIPFEGMAYRHEVRFPAKPAAATIAELKARGYKWDAVRKAWAAKVKNGIGPCDLLKTIRTA